MSNSWYHGNITRSRAEDLLSQAGKDGSYLVRDSESVCRAYALCVLYQNCVYTYRILQNSEQQLSVQASEGVAMRLFTSLLELIEFYRNENLGLVTHLQYPILKEDEGPEEPDEEQEQAPPDVPPRNFASTLVSADIKEIQMTLEKPALGNSSLLLSETLLQRLQDIDSRGVPEEHLQAIRQYLSLHISSDCEMARNGCQSLPQLKKLLMTLCSGLYSEVTRTLPILESLQSTFDSQLSPGFRQRSPLSGDSNTNHMISKLTQLTSLVSGLEEKMKTLITDGTVVKHRRSLIPPIVFEVKADSLGISQKTHLKVDVETGKLIIKKSKDGPDDKFYPSKKILQLIKSQKFPNKLVIVLETEKEKTHRKEYVFSDSKKREGFCQLLQQMKNKHSGQPEPDMLTIFTGTWNMGAAPPPKRITSWFMCKGQGKTRDETADYIEYDIYVIGTQEDPLSEKEWVDILLRSLNEITSSEYKLITIQTLWNIRIVILAKQEHEHRISHVCTNSVKTGIANTLGNKGAVGASFMFNGTSFGFINSHLTSGSEKKLRRKQNYFNILRFLVLGDKKLSPFNLTHRFTHLFWLGDLNYRVQLPNSEAENIVQKIKLQQYQELLPYDQLNMERRESQVFLHFNEEEITFPPTYRFDRGSRERYCYTKQKATGMKYNLPSWCDRVLWKSYPLMHVLCQSYGCTEDITTSDHSPVFATFEVGVTSQFVSKNRPGDPDSQGHIELMNCKAALHTKSHTKFYIEFHSSCLENMVKSPESEDQESDNGMLVVKFGVLPKLTPIISDPEYLLDQHLLVCIKSYDTDESYGEGCIALRMEDPKQQVSFFTPLAHHGEATGYLQGEICLPASEGKQREKLYDFVKIEKDETVAHKQPKPQNNQHLEQTWSFKGFVDKSSIMARMLGVQVCPPEAHSSIDHSGSIPVFSGQVKQSPPDTPPGYRGNEQRPKPGSPVQGRGDNPITPPPRSTAPAQKFTHPNTARTGLTVRQQDSQTANPSDTHEMVDNPLYGAVSGALYPPAVQVRSLKPPEPMARPCPAIRPRSMTCSSTDKKPAPMDKTTVKNTLFTPAPQATPRPETVPTLQKQRPPVPAKIQATRESQHT
ncbi:phosphatidylinositol 3,4,5-trisphosphate 5-phosphatase 1 isoform X2 [Spea bombifrons]|uniref:phosphatidylinositol 3,4,5-trisphosphate 5-phosphatase 1 isoform X2 n=1 Tax=Spea bombifrons TaxID=233779 RepID=UPI002349C8D2|nr:phosphatidylinositol 3,4,5-trisphosphate 5-phosphatase 1 isoform X2 [Spea bombifrons]